LIPKQDVGFATLATRTCINLVSRVLAHTFKFSVSRSRSPPYNLLPRVPLDRFAGLKHRQLVRQVGVIITTDELGEPSSTRSISSVRSLEIAPCQLTVSVSVWSTRIKRQRKSSTQATSYCLPGFRVNIELLFGSGDAHM
jgi:hypothetical protein